MNEVYAKQYNNNIIHFILYCIRFHKPYIGPPTPCHIRFSIIVDLTKIKFKPQLKKLDSTLIFQSALSIYIYTVYLLSGKLRDFIYPISEEMFNSSIYYIKREYITYIHRCIQSSIPENSSQDINDLIGNILISS